MAFALEGVTMPRPMTYQLAANLPRVAGARVSEVRVTRLAEMTYCALVVMEGPKGLEEVDARPSDALNLALVADAPMRVDPGLLMEAEAVLAQGFGRRR